MMNGSVSLRDGPASVVAQWGLGERLIGGASRVRYRVWVSTPVCHHCRGMSGAAPGAPSRGSEPSGAIAQNADLLAKLGGFTEQVHIEHQPSRG
jgi:hypothetical protein